MGKMQQSSTVYVVAVVTDILVLVLSGVNGAPSWNTPSTTSFTIDSTVNTACDSITVLAGSGSGGLLSFSVNSQTPNGDFATDVNGITTDDFLKCNIATIQAGSSDSYTVILRLSEASSTSVDLTLTITITGLNLNTNSNAPVFTGTPYPITINRDDIDTSAYDIGSTLYTVTTTDGDSDTVTVSIETQFSPFRISGHDIQVDNKTAISELATPYEFVLKATDDGSPILTSSATVTVTINNGMPELSSLTLITAVLIALLTFG